MEHGKPATLAPHQHQGAFTLDATIQLSCQKPAVGVWAVCPRNVPWTTPPVGRDIPTGQQSKTRALVAGLVALAKRTSTPLKAIVQMATVSEAWTNKRHRQAYLDLLEDIHEQDFQRKG